MIDIRGLRSISIPSDYGKRRHSKPSKPDME